MAPVAVSRPSQIMIQSIIEMCLMVLYMAACLMIGHFRIIVSRIQQKSETRSQKFKKSQSLSMKSLCK